MHDVHAFIYIYIYTHTHTAQHDVHTVDKAQYATHAGSETGILRTYADTALYGMQNCLCY